MKRYISTFLSLALLSACGEHSGPILVSLVDQQVSEVEHRTQIEANGGAFVAPVLVNDGPLDNPAQPEQTSILEGKLVSFSRFEDRKELEDFVNTMVESGALTSMTEASVLHVFPFIGRGEELCRLGAVRRPAFVLGNLIEQAPLLRDGNAYKIIRYMMENTPRLKDAGVRFVSPVLLRRSIVGETKFGLLFLTIWPNRETFDTVHSVPDFIELAQQTRNQVFLEFTETQLRPLSDDSWCD